jgi:hypothetical protein
MPHLCPICGCRWYRRIDAVVARNRLDYSHAFKADTVSEPGCYKGPKQVPVMFPWEVTQRLEAGFDLSLLDDSDETLQRLFKNDISVFDEALGKRRCLKDTSVMAGETVSSLIVSVWPALSANVRPVQCFRTASQPWH